jgi:hypothetical protein
MKRWLWLLIPTIGLDFLPARALAAEPSGIIAAQPNPCRIERGQRECTSHITWNTQNVTHARVLVKSEAKEGEKEREFSGSLSCEAHRCPAPWIRPDTRYVFKLYDYSSGSQGRELGVVTVTATKVK